MLPSLPTPTRSPFDAIRRTHERGQEYWSARELQPLLEYVDWRKFEDAIERARAACENSGQDSREHFVPAAKMVGIGSSASREILDYHLTRYAGYLVAMNGDPRKPAVANAQTYFAARTHEAERRALERPSDPVLAQLQLLAEVRTEQLALAHRTADIERDTALLRARLDAAPIQGEQRGQVFRLGRELGQAIGNYRRAWRTFNDHFGLASYKDLPASRFEEACHFLRLQIASYTGREALLDTPPKEPT